MEAIVNKVAESGLITLDLAPYMPTDEVVLFDLKPFLFREMILREKDYRAALQEFDWKRFEGRHVAAYLAITEHLRPVVKSLMYGEPCSTVPIYKKPK